MKVCCGGTFDNFHAGHEKLLQNAISLAGKDTFYVGVTTNEMVRNVKEKVQRYEIRKKNLVNFFKKNAHQNYEIIPIRDIYGTATYEDYEGIVVSEETKKVAEKINRIRMRSKLKPLKIFVIDMVYAEDSLPISSTRIRRGEIDRNGRLIRKLKIAVGSKNKLKISAVENVFGKVFERISVKSVNLNLTTPEQPFAISTIKYAILRAKKAYTPEFHYAVGIEAGLFKNEYTKEYFDVHYCAILDRKGEITVGHSGGFKIPENIVKIIKSGKSLSSAFEHLYNIKDIGKKEGAIGYLSKGYLNRKKLLQDAVFMALVPRLNKMHLSIWHPFQYL